MTITVLNRRDGHGPDAEYIGRPSPLGNPYKIGEWSRDEVIAKYREWLGGKSLLSNAGNELFRLAKKYSENGKLDLVCWCSPEACHGDVIKEYIEKIVSK